jgi:hypothetical protein
LDAIAFEAHAAIVNGDKRPQLLCDFSCGVLVGFLQGFTGRDEFSCFEETCRVARVSAYLFRIDGEVTRKASINRNFGRKLHHPRA